MADLQGAPPSRENPGSGLSWFGKVRRHAGSVALVMVMTVVSLLPIRPPIHPGFWWLSLDTTSGTLLYFGAIIFLALAVIHAVTREGEAREARDERVINTLDLQVENTGRTLVQQGEIYAVIQEIRQLLPAAAPLLDKDGTLGKRIEAKILEFVGGGTIRITGSAETQFKKAVEILRDVNDNPPSTPEAAQQAARQITVALGIAEESDQALPITPARAPAWHRMPPWVGGEDELPSQPPITPSASDSEGGAK